MDGCVQCLSRCGPNGWVCSVFSGCVRCLSRCGRSGCVQYQRRISGCSFHPALL